MMLNTETIEHTDVLADNRGFSTSDDPLFSCIDIPDRTSTSPSLTNSFQDSNTSSTDLNIHKRLLTKDPLIEIENQIVDTLGTEFNDDFDSYQYESKLTRIIADYDSLAIMVFSTLLDTQRIKFLQAIELLRFIGKINHPPTYLHRTWLLEKNLFAMSKYVRDGASLGLLYLENPSTIKPLKEAIDREPTKQLRENMIQVLGELEKNNATSITDNSI